MHAYEVLFFYGLELFVLYGCVLRKNIWNYGANLRNVNGVNNWSKSECGPN